MAGSMCAEVAVQWFIGLLRRGASCYGDPGLSRLLGGRDSREGPVQQRDIGQVGTERVLRLEGKTFLLCPTKGHEHHFHRLRAESPSCDPSATNSGSPGGIASRQMRQMCAMRLIAHWLWLSLAGRLDGEEAQSVSSRIRLVAISAPLRFSA